MNAINNVIDMRTPIEVALNIDVEGNKAVDYKLTAHFAKKLSVKGNSEKAEQAREYFTTVEERVKQSTE